jgi:hypothetical protein
MHVHSHMPNLQPNLAPRPLKREPPSDGHEIRSIFEQAGQRPKHQQQHRPGHPAPGEAFDAAVSDDGPARPHETAETNQLWSLLGSVAAASSRSEPETPAAELSLDALLAQVVKPA